MSQEIIYTSAPQGLKVGSRGFCTVASSSGMAKPLADYLESLSGYRHVFPPDDPNARLNPVCYSHLITKVAGQRYHVLSRISDAGLDYSQRTNKLAHHLAFSTTELVEAGPAWVLSQPGFMETAWSGEPRLLSAGRRPPQGNASPAVCHTWKQVTGDDGWGGVLAETIAASATGEAYLIYRPGMDMLPLLLEAQLLLPTDMRWQATFSSYYTKLPPGAQCRWKCVLADSAEAIAAQRARSSLVLDLTAPLGAAPNSAWAEAARRGTSPKQTVAPSRSTSPVGEPLGLAPETLPAASRPSLNAPLELAATPPSLKAAMGAQGQGSEGDLFDLSFRPARPRGANAFGAKPKKKWPKVVALLVLLLVLAGAGGAAGVWWWNNQHDEKDQEIASKSEGMPAKPAPKKPKEVIPDPPPEEKPVAEVEDGKRLEEETPINPVTPSGKDESGQESPTESAVKATSESSGKDSVKLKTIPPVEVSPYIELDDDTKLVIGSEISPSDVEELLLLGDRYELKPSTGKNQVEWSIEKIKTGEESVFEVDAPVASLKFKDNSLHFEWQEMKNDTTEPQLKYHVLQLTTSDNQVKYIPFSDQKCEPLQVSGKSSKELKLTRDFPKCDSYRISKLRVEGIELSKNPKQSLCTREDPFNIDCGPEKRVRISIFLEKPNSNEMGALIRKTTVQHKDERYRSFPNMTVSNEVKKEPEYKAHEKSIREIEKKLEKENQKKMSDQDKKAIERLEGRLNAARSEFQAFKDDKFKGFNDFWPNFEELDAFQIQLETVSMHFVVLGHINSSDESPKSVEFPILVVGERPKELVEPNKK